MILVISGYNTNINHNLKYSLCFFALSEPRMDPHSLKKTVPVCAHVRICAS